jgi:hypothetical protein
MMPVFDKLQNYYPPGSYKEKYGSTTKSTGSLSNFSDPRQTFSDPSKKSGSAIGILSKT